jgi:hypothetical protein
VDELKALAIQHGELLAKQAVQPLMQFLQKKIQTAQSCKNTTKKEQKEVDGSVFWLYNVHIH